MPQKSEREANPYGNKLQIMIRHMLNTLLRGAFGIVQVSLGIRDWYFSYEPRSLESVYC